MAAGANNDLGEFKDGRAEFEAIQLDGMRFEDRYRIFTGAVVPRPIAFVSSLNEDGTVNAAPFSSFMIASVEAGYLAFSVGPSDLEEKETLRNVRRLEEFVINTVSENLAQQVQFCGEHHPGVARKIDLAGLRLIPSECIKTPRIADTSIQFECRLHTILRFGDSHMVVGGVLLMHARSGLVRNGKIDPLEYAPLGRIAGRNYCAVRDIISV
jgi:flavin reductase (DIM6/NTAB) family NADH-FMN oxidoreductase RutF